MCLIAANIWLEMDVPRIPYSDPAKASGPVRAVLEGQPANVGRMMAVASEPVFLSFSSFVLALLNDSSLPPMLRELAILRVGYLSDAAYELFQHEALGRQVGLSEGQLAAIKAGDSAAPALSEAEAAVLEFVDDVAGNVRASDETLAAVRRHLDDRQVMDLILMTGAYMMVSRMLETTGVEMEEEALDWIKTVDPQ